MIAEHGQSAAGSSVGYRLEELCTAWFSRDATPNVMVTEPKDNRNDLHWNCYYQYYNGT